MSVCVCLCVVILYVYTHIYVYYTFYTHICVYYICVYVCMYVGRDVNYAEQRLLVLMPSRDFHFRKKKTSPNRDSSQMSPSRVETFTKHYRVEMMLF